MAHGGFFVCRILPQGNPCPVPRGHCSKMRKQMMARNCETLTHLWQECGVVTGDADRALKFDYRAFEGLRGDFCLV